MHEEGYGCESVDGAIRFYDPQGRLLGQATEAVGYALSTDVSAETSTPLVRDACADSDSGFNSWQFAPMGVRDRPVRLSG